jgi:hypothetical protein
MVTIHNNADASAEILALLQVAADALGVDVCWYYCGDFHFRLEGEWTVSLTPESAGRLCVETWFALRLRDRRWSRSSDCRRVRELVRAARENALDPV